MKKLLLGILWLWLATSTQAQVSDATLTTQSNQVKNETIAAANTATRVGTVFLNLTNSKGNKQEANTWLALQTFTASASNAGLRLGTKSGADPTGSTGQAYFNTTSTQFRFYDGTWRYPTLNDGLNDGRVLFASSNRAVDDADLTFTGGNTLNATNLIVSGTLTATITGTLSGLTNTRVPFATGATAVADDADMTFTGGNQFNVTKFLGGLGTPVTSADVSTIVYSGSAASGNTIAQAVNVRQSVATTGVAFGDYVKAYADHPSGTVNQLLAIQGNAEHAGAGTVTNARGILGGTLTTNGAITTAIGVKAEGVFIAGSGTVTTSTALDIIGATVGSGTVTNNYGLYQHGSTPLNVMEGKLGIGGSPSFPLDVQGASAGTHVLRILNTSTGNASIQLQRTSGTTSTWEMVIPSASTNLVLYSGSNLFTFTTAGLLTGTSFQATGLTSTRVPIIGASGLIGDDADFAFTGGTTLETHTLKVGTALSTSGVLYSSVYTPTATTIANLDGTSMNDVHYVRIGNQVIMSGQFDADATTAAGTTTRFRITIPVATDFVGPDQAGGSGNFQGVTSQPVSVYADTANEQVIFHWRALDTANQSFTWIVKYLVQ